MTPRWCWYIFALPSPYRISRACLVSMIHDLPRNRLQHSWWMSIFMAGPLWVGLVLSSSSMTGSHPTTLQLEGLALTSSCMSRIDSANKKMIICGEHNMQYIHNIQKYVWYVRYAYFSCTYDRLESLDDVSLPSKTIYQSKIHWGEGRFLCLWYMQTQKPIPHLHDWMSEHQSSPMSPHAQIKGRVFLYIWTLQLHA